MSRVGASGNSLGGVACTWGLLPHGCPARELTPSPADCAEPLAVSGAGAEVSLWNKMSLRRVSRDELGSCVWAGGDGCLAVQEVILAGPGEVGGRRERRENGRMEQQQLHSCLGDASERKGEESCLVGREMPSLRLDTESGVPEWGRWERGPDSFRSWRV